MTKQEFIARQREMMQNGNKRILIWIVLFFGGIFGCAALASYLDRHPEESLWIEAAVGIGLFAFILVNLGLMLWFGVRQQRRFGHRCPACNKALIGVLVQVAIASGCCGHCGAKVFSSYAG